MKIKKTIKNSTISSTDLEEYIKLESIDKDVEELISRHAGSRINTSSYGEVLKNKRGFFLMFIKKDMDMPRAERIKITTFAQLINMEEVINGMDKVLSDMAAEQKKPISIA